jgi:hypothetical protein
MGCDATVDFTTINQHEATTQTKATTTTTMTAAMTATIPVTTAAKATTTSTTTTTTATTTSTTTPTTTMTATTATIITINQERRKQRPKKRRLTSHKLIHDLRECAGWQFFTVGQRHAGSSAALVWPRRRWRGCGCVSALRWRCVGGGVVAQCSIGSGVAVVAVAAPVAAGWRCRRRRIAVAQRRWCRLPVAVRLGWLNSCFFVGLRLILVCTHPPTKIDTAQVGCGCSQKK